MEQFIRSYHSFTQLWGPEWLRPGCRVSTMKVDVGAMGGQSQKRVGYRYLHVTLSLALAYPLKVGFRHSVSQFVVSSGHCSRSCSRRYLPIQPPSKHTLYLFNEFTTDIRSINHRVPGLARTLECLPLQSRSRPCHRWSWSPSLNK